jgi:hypothetical protein
MTVSVHLGLAGVDNDVMLLALGAIVVVAVLIIQSVRQGRKKDD